jgi:hypothetical protein
MNSASEWFKWVIATASALFIYFFVENPIENAILNAFQTSFVNDPIIVTFITILKITLAFAGAIWVLRLLSSHPN